MASASDTRPPITSTPAALGIPGNYHFGTGECEARPIEAELVDRELVAGLDQLLVDFKGWRAQIEDRHASVL